MSCIEECCMHYAHNLRTADNGQGLDELSQERRSSLQHVVDLTLFVLASRRSQVVASADLPYRMQTCHQWVVSYSAQRVRFPYVNTIVVLY